MLKSDSPASSVSIQCFEKEARSLAQMNHPNIVQIYEVGEHEGRSLHQHGILSRREPGPGN